jgi:hypothetical protein
VFVHGFNNKFDDAVFRFVILLGLTTALTQQKPNILVIFGDDVGMIACHSLISRMAPFCVTVSIPLRSIVPAGGSRSGVSSRGSSSGRWILTGCERACDGGWR